jgi:hypothetical protein
MSNNYVAQVINNIVNEIIVGDYEWVVANLPGEWHDLGGDPLTVCIGYTYDAATDTFTPPPTPEANDETNL